MAAIATVVGQGGTTVTLNWQTASNAAIAQHALGAITDGVAAGTMQEVSYTGGSILPPLANGTVVGVVLAEGVGTAAHAPIQMGGQYEIGISNDTSATPAAQAWVVPFTAGAGGAAADTIFVGGGGGDVANFGANTQIFLAGQGPQSVQELGLLGWTTPSANIFMDGNATVDASNGSTTINIDDLIGASAAAAPFGSQLTLMNNGAGHSTVNIATSTSTVPGSVATDVIFLTGTGTVPAIVNGAGSAASGPAAAGTVQPQVWVVAEGPGAASINGGASQLVVFGGPGPMTVDGGTGKGDIAVFTSGRFQAGSGGNALMAGAINPSAATTLIGGGNGDIFFGLSNNTTMVAGAGSETEVSFAPNPLLGAPGAVFQGNLGLGASTTTMINEIAGGSTFIVGHGSTTITEAPGLLTGSNTFKEGAALNNAGDTATINGFNVGTDTISLNNPRGGNYTTVLGNSPAVDQIGLQFTGGNTVLNFGDGSKWTVVGATVTGSNFHST